MMIFLIVSFQLHAFSNYLSTYFSVEPWIPILFNKLYYINTIYFNAQNIPGLNRSALKWASVSF